VIYLKKQQSLNMDTKNFASIVPLEGGHLPYQKNTVTYSSSNFM